jgi:hypothetical protein
MYLVYMCYTLWEIVEDFEPNMKVLHVLEHYNKIYYFQLYVGIFKKITTLILNFVTIIWVMHK